MGIQITPGEIASLVGGTVHGDAQRPLQRISTLQAADAACVSFLANPRYRMQLAESKAGCVIVSATLLPLAPHEVPHAALVAVADPYAAYAALSRWWAAQVAPQPQAGIHPSAVVESGARIHPSATVGPLSWVGSGAVVGERVRIGPRGVVERDAHLGDDTRLAPGVTVLAGCRVGERCLLHPGVVIGADGFGFAPTAQGWSKIEQLGAVRIGDDVEIGANTCIDRGALEDTVIGDGVKLDNLIQIGHNVRIGARTAMAGCVGIAGSAVVGQRCTVGGGAIILGHLEVADDVHISAATVVTRSIARPGQYSGVFPFDENAAWEKNAATLRQLYSLRDRLRQLERRMPADPPPFTPTAP